MSENEIVSFQKRFHFLSETSIMLIVTFEKCYIGRFFSIPIDN